MNLKAILRMAGCTWQYSRVLIVAGSMKRVNRVKFLNLDMKNKKAYN
jgi:hypothetical protein